MPTERLAPSAILLQTNLSGVVAAIQDDPDAPDGTWLTANNDGNDTDLRVSFATPATAPVAGAGLQEFRAWLRSTGGGDNPDATIYVYESGVLRATSSPFSIGSTSGQIASFTWNASVLSDPTGAGVECRIFGNAAGGLLDPDDTVEVGAVEWNAAIVGVGSASYASSLGPNSAYTGASAFATGPFSSLGVNSTAVSVADAGTSPISSVGPNSAYEAVAALGPDYLSSLGPNSSYEASADFCSGDIERLPPDAILEQTNLVGTVSDIDDDPDAPDGSWLETPLLGLLLPTSVRTSFPTPTVSLDCGEPAFSPADIDGLWGWWDANDAVVVSSLISQLNDRSGNARHMSQPTATQQPALLTNALNARSVAHFDGVDDFLTYATLLDMPPGQTGSFFAVVRREPSATEDTLLAGAGPTGGLAARQALDFNGAGELKYLGLNNITSDDAVTAAFSLVEFHSDGVSYEFVIDSVVQSLTVAAGADDGLWWGDVVGITHLDIGAMAAPAVPDVSNEFSGDWAEGLLYDAVVLTPSEKQDVRAYLNGKYGL